MNYESIVYDVGDDHVATVTLNRPEQLNAFTPRMCEEVQDAWRRIKRDDAVRVVVLRAAGERAFNVGDDNDARWPTLDNIWSSEDPGDYLGPKTNQLWKPIVCAVNGLCAAAAFYLVNESDIVICSDDAQFFDPHVHYGWVAALEPIGLAKRVNVGDVLRMALLGLDERMSAERALQIGLVTEIVAFDGLWVRAHELAAVIARKPPAAVQGTVRAIWDSLDLGRVAARERGLLYTQIGNPRAEQELGPEPPPRPRWTLR